MLNASMILIDHSIIDYYLTLINMQRLKETMLYYL